MGDDCNLDDRSRIHSKILGLGTYEQGFCYSLVFFDSYNLERGSFDRFRPTTPTKTKFGIHWRVDIVLAFIVDEGDA